jgi:hypothetical protein
MAVLIVNENERSPAERLGEGPIAAFRELRETHLK